MEGLTRVVAAPSLSFRKQTDNSRIRTNKFIVVSCSRGDKNGSDFSGFSRFEGNGADVLQGGPTQAPFTSPDKGSQPNPNDIMKLFNDAQQNILYLNKQRLMAVEELKKAQREKELLLAKVGQLEAESKSNAAECEVVKRKLNLMEAAMMTGGLWSIQKSKKNAMIKIDPPSIFSEMLLRIDSMVLEGAVSKGQASEMRSLVMNKDSATAETFYNLQHKNDRELAAGLLPLLDPKKRKGLHIVHICTEMAPITKVGSMASHVMGLCRALRRRNNLVEVILPMYSFMDMSHVQNLREMKADFYASFGGQWHRNKIWTGVICGIAVTFIEPFHPSVFFARERLYGYDDDFERFTYFCRASLDYLVKSGKQPDILHLHNWQTASVAPLFWDMFVNQGLGNTRILFTCHDFSSQGVQEPEKLGLCGLDPHRLHRPDRLQDNVEPGLVNLLKGGIVYSNKVMTVTTPYTNDVMTREHGHGLEPTLAIHKDKLMGVPYGLDDMWDPATDKFLPATYSVEDLTGKAICKASLRRHVGLFDTQTSTPIVGCVYLDKLDTELHFIKSSLQSVLRNGAQFVLVGASETPRIQTAMEELQKKFKNENCRMIFKYDEGILHLVIAGSDVLLCSSLHDPAHQMPIKAMKYGAIPVARKLDDKIQSEDDDENQGYKLESMQPMLHNTNHRSTPVSLTQVLDQMKDNPLGWKDMVKSGMMKDFSWDADCAETYMAAYWSIHDL
eukprot:Gb_24148 [translate_table: standard]